MGWKTDPDLGGKFLSWGKHSGSCFADLPERYIRWLINPVITDRATKTTKRVDVPKDIVETARAVITAAEREARSQQNALDIFHGQPHRGPGNLYYIEFCGEVERQHKASLHNDFDEALARLEQLYPLRHEAEDGFGEVFTFRETPDPDEDQILIWEILPSGHRKVIWHYSGTHLQKKHMIPQGRLPGDSEDLYTLAQRDR